MFIPTNDANDDTWNLVWAIKGSEEQWKAGSEGGWIPGPDMIKELSKVLEAAGQKHLI